MKLKPLRDNLHRYLVKRGLTTKYNKQVQLFEENWRHRSLKTEMLEPKEFKVYSFRIDRKYRAIFIIRKDEVEVVEITDHYQ